MKDMEGRRWALVMMLLLFMIVLALQYDFKRRMDELDHEVQVIQDHLKLMREVGLDKTSVYFPVYPSSHLEEAPLWAPGGPAHELEWPADRPRTIQELLR